MNFKRNQTVTNKKTGKKAIIYDVRNETILIKYLKNNEPFGPLRDVNKNNFK